MSHDMTMTDQELLEKAAKAAGVHIVPCTCGNPKWPFKHDEQKNSKWGHWNPLENDSDAFRLAVKLGLTINPYGDGVFVSRHEDEPVITERWGDDKAAATRRAIVRAAAHIADQPA